MNHFKKYPLFFALMTLLIAAFAALAVYDVLLMGDSAATQKKLKSQMNAYSAALKNDPTKKSIDVSEKNIADLEKRLAALEKDLTRAGGDIFKKIPENYKKGYQLREYMRGMVNNWRREAANRNIVVKDNMDFGYKKYVAPKTDAPKDAAVAPIWKQMCVLDYINKKLFASKSEKSPMAIISVQRELLASESAGGKADNRKRARVRTSAATHGDNFKIDDAVTARKAGSLDTLAFKFVFTGHTDVLRRFLNQLKDFDAMLVVRSIGVKPADANEIAMFAKPEADAALEGAFGDNSAANTENSGGETPSIDGAFAENGGAPEKTPEQLAAEEQARTPIVTDNISEFTVIIEYVEVVKEKPAADKTEKE